MTDDSADRPSMNPIYCPICSEDLAKDFDVEFAANYRGLVCRSCDERALDAEGQIARTGGLGNYGEDGDNPVFIDTVKCWRRYRFGGWVTMVDPYDSDSLEQFDDLLSSTRIQIVAGTVQVEALLNNSFTAQEIIAALPIEASANTWGDEIYFGIPVDADLEEGQEVVDMGDLGYWPPGRASCIFFGPTPASRGDEIRPASAVTVIGRVEGDATIFKQVRSGATVTIEEVEG